MPTEMPNPTEAQRESALFSALWDEVKDWDINVPNSYEGYCGGNGSHVALLYMAMEQALLGLVFEAAGAATGPLMQDHPDYVFPSEQVSERVKQVIREHTGIEPNEVEGYRGA